MQKTEKELKIDFYRNIKEIKNYDNYSKIIEIFNDNDKYYHFKIKGSFPLTKYLSDEESDLYPFNNYKYGYEDLQKYSIPMMDFLFNHYNIKQKKNFNFYSITMKKDYDISSWAIYIIIYLIPIIFTILYSIIFLSILVRMND